jgi:hypothetical protein
MTPAHANKGGARYRYYVSQAVLQRQQDSAGSVCRVPAPELEQVVMQAVRARLSQGHQDVPDHDVVTRLVERVVVRTSVLEITLRAVEGLEASVVEIPWSRPRHTRKRDLVVPEGREEGALRPIRPEARSKLLLSIARARAWLDELTTGRVTSALELAAREGLSERSVRMILSLAFLAPDLVKAAVNGTLTRGTGVTSLAELPAAWTEQHRILGSGTQCSGAIDEGAAVT